MITSVKYSLGWLDTREGKRFYVYGNNIDALQLAWEALSLIIDVEDIELIEIKTGKSLKIDERDKSC